MSGADWEAILFDLDGTLADTVELILRCYRHTTKALLGEELPDELWLSTLGRPLRDQLRLIGRSPQEAERMLETYVSFQKMIHDDMVRPYPGVGEVLEVLSRRGIALAVVTSKRSDMARRTLTCCGFLERFDALVCADHVTNGKPDPEPVHAALAKLGVRRPDRTLFVGDSPYDMEAGQRAGVKTAAALWGPFAEERLLEKEPDFVLQRIEGLLGLAP